MDQIAHCGFVVFERGGKATFSHLVLFGIQIGNWKLRLDLPLYRLHLLLRVEKDGELEVGIEISALTTPEVQSYSRSG